MIRTNDKNNLKSLPKSKKIEPPSTMVKHYVSQMRFSVQVPVSMEFSFQVYFTIVPVLQLDRNSPKRTHVYVT
jgi:hypothetical protein